MSLFQTNRWRPVHRRPGRRASPPSGPLRPPSRSGNNRSSTQYVRGRSLDRSGRRAGAARWSRPGRPRRHTTPRTASPGRPPRSAAQSRSFPTGTDLPGFRPDQEIDGPGGVGRRGIGEVAGHRLDLVVGLGRLVERGVEVGEGFHGPSSTVGLLARPSGSSARPRRRARLRTGSRSTRASRPLLAEPSGQDGRVAVGEQDPLGPGGLDRREQAGPVGVVREDEPAVDRPSASGSRGSASSPRRRPSRSGRTSGPRASRAPTAGRRSAPRQSVPLAPSRRRWSAAGRRPPRDRPGSAARPPRACRSGRCVGSSPASSRCALPSA